MTLTRAASIVTAAASSLLVRALISHVTSPHKAVHFAGTRTLAFFGGGWWGGGGGGVAMDEGDMS